MKTTLTPDDIIIGAFYKIVGTNGGCYGKICKHCGNFEKGIIVTDINKYYIKRKISGKAFNNKSHCHFDCRDLVKMTWKERYEGKK